MARPPLPEPPDSRLTREDGRVTDQLPGAELEPSPDEFLKRLADGVARGDFTDRAITFSDSIGIRGDVTLHLEIPIAGGFLTVTRFSWRSDGGSAYSKHRISATDGDRYLIASLSERQKGWIAGFFSAALAAHWRQRHSLQQQMLADAEGPGLE